MRDLNNLQPKHHSIIHSCLHGITQTLAKKSKPYKTTYTRLSKRIQNCLLPKFATNIHVCIIRSKNKNRELDSRFLKKNIIDNSLYIQSNCHARSPQISFWF